MNDCLQLSYLPSKRNHMLLLYPREILILDLELSQTVGVVAIERSGVPFIQVRCCIIEQRSVIRILGKLDTIKADVSCKPICSLNEFFRLSILSAFRRVFLMGLKVTERPSCCALRRFSESPNVSERKLKG